MINKKERHRLVMGRCFFVPKREGVIEKYINEKKELDVSEKHRTFAVDFKKNTK